MLALALSGLLSACDWVDSAGNQGVDPPSEELFDDVLAGDAIALDENSATRLTLAYTSSPGLTPTFTWSPEPVEQGDLLNCASVSNYNPEFAADGLEAACTSEEDCSFDIVMQEAEEDDEAASFDLIVPQLQASVGLQYELTIDDGAGRITTREQTFCLLSINEAPDAQDDTFVVTEGAVLTTTPDTINLLSNDSDDVDVTNEPLQVLEELLTDPMHAEVFELAADGSFTYQTSLTNLEEDQLDSFEYQITDGLFVSSAKVSIRVVASNQAPQQLDTIPLQAATEGVPFSLDLAPNFEDPEGGDISFSLSPETPFVEGTGFRLSTQGVLSGTPTAADVGSYALEVIVSDGGQSTTVPVAIEVDAAPAPVPNSSPEYTPQSVLSQSVVINQAITPVRPVFTDEDEDTLTYTMAGSRILPVGVRLNANTGVVSGTPRVLGIFNGLRVRATDPSGDSALSEAFSITVLGAP